MKEDKYAILMADVVGSRDSDQNILMHDFKELIKDINQEFEKNILSPLTITLGDEFQGIIINNKEAVKLILHLEERLISAESPFVLRYVLVAGKIETPINRLIAYEMMGEGLTRARELLNNSKKQKRRFTFQLDEVDQSKALTNAFIIFNSLTTDWNLEKDYKIVTSFFKHKDYKKVADELGKDRSLVWKREKSLKMTDYFVLKDLIQYIGGIH